MDESSKKGVKTQKSAGSGATRFVESQSSTNRPTVQQEAIRDSQTIALHATSSSHGDKETSRKDDGPAELTQRLSRAETVRQDARKLKTATLNRMGRMFKQRSQTPVADKTSRDIDVDINPIKSMENCNEEVTKKEKSNSLGRMLKLVDKDGSPKKLFHPRAGSLSRILRRHPNNDDNEDKKNAEDNTPGIFSRMLNQLRGRPQSGNSSLEPNLKTRNNKTGSSLPPKVPLNTRAPNPPVPTSSSPPQEQLAAGSPQKSTVFEYSL
ncbi:uncharacterized protein LOC108629939 [Ceratina calcarata]|uniref:Uncharacterized protein LOC108629939 n=1 Tax=Ceratina calcarata TaxID=156304 RepID=A0AAJ7J9X2_9HYME|nr:uncharacterized protein LOC108629939 [Ceratina calcarata]